ncbi:tetrapyrrole-binding protein, chloroplastic [Mercurialis annua]|uniref:tetrapyrrole-binding protein, chloroplastic n=1 Tax=Mercurialis annua TaxID=3986 RepID=UPI00215E9255|nr:tetrapyrrole-binding protein, chloroplastic [Mercurialis annua]
MATNSLHHHSHSLLNLQTSETPLFLKPTTTISTATAATKSLSLSISSTTTATFSISPTTSTTTPSTSQTFSLDLLQHHLSTQNFREADEETRRLIIVLAGEAAQKRGYVFFSEVKFISKDDLIAIDELWKKYSDNKFGYSVQKKIWQQKSKKDFSKFFVNVGWMKKLDTEVLQYNYKSFPSEFIWELNDETPQGHLPLTNALRGTQLLNCIFTHPAFDAEEDEEAVEGSGNDNGNGGIKGLKPLTQRVFKSDYSF